MKHEVDHEAADFFCALRQLLVFILLEQQRVEVKPLVATLDIHVEDDDLAHLPQQALLELPIVVQSVELLIKR